VVVATHDMKVAASTSYVVAVGVMTMMMAEA
jgi:hypothetical protein